MRWVAGACLGAFASAGCGAAQRRDPRQRVAVGEWCSEVGRAYCGAMASQCFGGMQGFAEGCRESFVQSCVAGRSPDAPGGRTGAELDQCTAEISSASCGGLGGGLAGELGARCSVSDAAARSGP